MWRPLLVLLLVAAGASAQEFEYRTFVAGLGSVGGSNGVAVADYDGDGDLDVYVVVRAAYDAGDTRTWNRLFANRGDGTFVDQTRRSGALGSAGIGLPNTGGNGAKLGAAWGDYDGDGWPDLYLTHAGPNQLYRNNGDGTFSDVTDAAGVAGGATQLSTSAFWFDADLDGDLDLHVGVWEDYAPASAPRDLRNPYFENLGDGTFRDATSEAGLGDPGKTYTALPVDVDEDGDPDVYDANDFGENRLSLNAGDGTFTEATAAWGLEDRGEGMGLALGDPNCDGRLDLFLTNRSDGPGQTHALFLAASGGGYDERATEAGVDSTGWGWGAEFFDLENDGDEDLFVVNGYFAADTPNNLFRNDGPFPFQDVAAASGVADLAPGRGLVVFDADEDGRLDVLVANVDKAPSLYGNRTEAGAWLAVNLEDAGANRNGLGAVVEVEAGGRRWVRSHHGAQFLGQSLLPVHVGLGTATSVERVVVRWPGGGEDEATGLAVDQTVRMRRGVGLVEGRAVAGEAAPRHRPSLSLRIAPNPSRGAVRLRIEADRAQDVEIRVFDALGRTVWRHRRPLPTGVSTVTWDGRDVEGRPLAQGTYLVRVSGAGAFATGAASVLR